MSATWRIIEGDCRDVLRTLPEQSVHTCVTSPPYFGLRDYGTGEWEGGDPGCDHLAPPGGGTGASTLGPNKDGLGQAGVEQVTVQRRQQYRDTCGLCSATRVDHQLGLEPTPDEFVAALVSVFREVRRVLRDDGTVWLNLGDSYASSPPGIKSAERYKASGLSGHPAGMRNGVLAAETADKLDTSRLPGIKPKDLIGIPWMVAFALRADGWYLRSDIIWAKPNPMPESVTDRPTKAHEYLFLLSKGPRYFYDADAIREKQDEPTRRAATFRNGGVYTGGRSFDNDADDTSKDSHGDGESAFGRNKRSVWTIATQPYAGAHFATFPPKLIEPCIQAGAPEHGTVLDPFCGAGTTGLVALQHHRQFVGIELNPAYAAMARTRIETAVRLGFRTASNGAAVIPGQLDIFETG